MPVATALSRLLAALRIRPQWTLLLCIGVAGDDLALERKTDRRRAEQQPSGLVRRLGDALSSLVADVAPAVQDDFVVLEKHDLRPRRRTAQKPPAQRSEHDRGPVRGTGLDDEVDRKSTRLNSSHPSISY